ncbi:MAG: hypothetical protein FJX59_15410 [Alphaproteobacteria bacterium]|nr:hypothetical protein [Alphaproteobacteria bacterium]
MNEDFDSKMSVSEVRLRERLNAVDANCDATSAEELTMHTKVDRNFLTCRHFLVIVFALGGGLGANPALAQAGLPGQDRPATETECRLKYLRNTKSEVARSYIGKSCNFLSLRTASSVLARQERVFHECVVEALPGTEDDRNSVELANACRERAWSR